MSEVCHLLRLVDVQLVSGSIAATGAFAALVADATFGEAFAIHLQTVDFRTFATGMRLLPRGKVQLRDGSHDLLFFCIGSFLVNEKQVEEISGVCECDAVFLDLVIGNEFE